MCGIVSICYGHENPELGQEAGELLKRLEYRGYDSTGGAFLSGQGIRLLKRVGAPSRVVPELGIDREAGQRFIGQVRWATYGAVTDVNSQPHHVACRPSFVGAHNGNISNTDRLKPALLARGHRVVSDNDGEMITHLAEEAFSAGLADPEPLVAAGRKACAASGLPALPDAVLLLVEAARRANREAEGSYAAAFADLGVPGVVAVKSGSSLYAGIGTDAQGDFVLVSSDLTSVLSKTRMLIPLVEGQGLWFTERDYVVFPLEGELAFSRPRPKRSKLNVRDTALRAPYRTYMEQEIASSPENLDEILRYYFAWPETEGLFAAFEAKAGLCKVLAERVQALYDCPDEASLGEAFGALRGEAACAELLAFARPFAAGLNGGGFVSDEKQLFLDLARLAPGDGELLKLLDRLFVWKKRRKVADFLAQAREALRRAHREGGRVYLVASGTSYHAALVGATFFNNLAGIPVFPANPGQFRASWLKALTGKDVLIGITQSGETKDLVDIFQEVRERAPQVMRMCLVNNENSRIPQELSAFYLPLLCGPEIAVAATKSFISQLAVLYVLAAQGADAEARIAEKLERARALITETLAVTGEAVERAAERLFLAPSMHILGTGLYGLAREGALKIREVVLNHTEGYDAAEFKHGPNTILGKNTLFSVQDLAELLDHAARLGAGEGPEALKAHPELLEARFGNYPLLFLCSSEERDTRITISQIHTHKIRGADVVVISEPNPELAAAAAGKPMGQARYWSTSIEVPPAGDPNLFIFEAAVVLQRLALRMSVRKAAFLDALGVQDHGVDPDAPKNVSKSITVD